MVIFAVHIRQQLMKKKSILIADQDQSYRTYVKNFLKDYTGFFIAAECCNGLEAIRNINSLEPDLVFMETELPGKDGFSILEETDHLPHVIFSASKAQHAHRAFENNAVDYLIKPFTRERFSAAMKKYAQLRIHPNAEPETVKHYNSYILLESEKRLKSIPLSAIIYLKAERDYTWVYTSNDTEYLSSYGIGYWENRLDPRLFLRIHRSYIIHIVHLKEFYRDASKMFALMHNGIEINVGRNYLSGIKKLAF